MRGPKKGHTYEKFGEHFLCVSRDPIGYFSDKKPLPLICSWYGVFRAKIAGLYIEKRFWEQPKENSSIIRLHNTVALPSQDNLLKGKSLFQNHVTRKYYVQKPKNILSHDQWNVEKKSFPEKMETFA